MTRPCPCGAETTYDACCEPMLDGHPAPTAERLMRSRYTAFSTGHSDHLFRTWHPRARPAQVVIPPGIEWLGLEVLGAEEGGEGDESGTVEFVARHRSADGDGELRETSSFVRRAGRWFYVGPVESPQPK